MFAFELKRKFIADAAKKLGRTPTADEREAIDTLKITHGLHGINIESAKPLNAHLRGLISDLVEMNLEMVLDGDALASKNPGGVIVAD